MSRFSEFGMHVLNCEVMVAYFCHHLSENYVDLSDHYVDLSDLYVDLSDNFVVICIALIGQEHVFKICFLTNEYVTSQQKYLTRLNKDLTSQYNYLTMMAEI